MDALFVTFVAGFGITFVPIPSIIKVARAKQLYDVPEDRKQHLSATPTLGGVAIFAGFLLSALMFVGNAPFPELRSILCAVIILFFVGVKDDLLHTVAYKKLLAQVFAATLIICIGDVRLTSFYGLFGVYEVSLPVSIGLSLVCMVGITNAFNFIDGVDGLAGTLGIIACTFFGIWFANHGLEAWAMLALALSGALLGFLYYNRTPAKIFMGDTGSLILGLVCAVLAVKFIELNRAYSYVRSAPVIAMAALAIPLYDTVRVMVIRVANGISPFSGDRNHLHHLLTDLGLSHMKTTGVLAALNIAILAFAYNAQRIGEHVGLGEWNAEVLLVVLVAGLTCFSFLLGRLNRVRISRRKFALLNTAASDPR